MRTLLTGVITLLVISTCFYSCKSKTEGTKAPAATESAVEEGWVVLFNGTDTEGWRGYGKEVFPEKGWVIEDGTLRCIGSGEGEAGGGMVKAVVNGKKELVDLVIDDSLYNPGDKDMLKDLIVAATNIAMEKADILAKEEMKKATEGMMPNIPGLDLSGMM